MAQLTYTPLGRDGCRCDLESDGGLRIELVLTGGAGEPTVTGDEVLRDSRAVVRALHAFAANERAARRSRSVDRRTAHREEAARQRATVTSIADLVDDLGARGRAGYCSACFSWGFHRFVDRRLLTPDAYICGDCGAVTTPCRVPRCPHMAIRSPNRSIAWARYCAEHLHAIPSFTKVDDRLEALDRYAEWLTFERRNAKRMTVIVGGALLGGAMVAPMLFAAAPAIGGAIGAWSGLSGAAATSHGLAVLGGGALASGGFGMAGGTAVVTAAGAALGTALGTSVTTSYVSSDPSFAIEQVQEGVGGPVVFSSGFLTEAEHGWGAWEAIIKQRYPNRPAYRLHWGAKELKHLGHLIGRELGARGTLGLIASVAKQSGRTAPAKLSVIGNVLTAAGIAKNPWTVAVIRANMTGAIVADLIARTNIDDYVLIGHSLGARVMVSTMQTLATRQSGPKIEAAHLLGAAVNNAIELHAIDAAVSGTVWNYWSSNDAVLRRLYRGAQLGRSAAGATGFRSSSQSVRNRNVSRQVPSHAAYIGAVSLAGSDRTPGTGVGHRSRRSMTSRV